MNPTNKGRSHLCQAILHDDAMVDALGQCLMDALEDLWSVADRSLLQPETVRTLELLEELADG